MHNTLRIALTFQLLLAGMIPLRAPAQTADSTPTVTRVYGINPSNPAEPSDEIGLNDSIVVVIEHLGSWQAALGPQPKVVPYINGLAIRGNYPMAVDTSSNQITFRLKRIQDGSTENRDAWITLLRRPGLQEYTRPVTLTVGTEDGREVLPIQSESTAANLNLVVLPRWWPVLAILLVGIVAALGVFAVRSDILRDTDLQPFGTDERKPFSLARTQMAIWFVLIIASYAVIWAITGDLGNIPDTVLGLMGISAGTAVAAVVMDTSRRTEQQQKRTDERTRLGQELAAVDTQITALDSAAQPNQLKKLDAERAQLQVRLEKLNPKSRSFFLDILSDADGVSFHRFQIFAWTLVLAVIFISTVYNTLAMPAFNGTLLGLMGISAGTYLGFKVPEART